VNQASNRTFTAPGLSQNEYGHICLCKQFYLRAKLPHGGTDAEEEFILSERLNVFARHLDIRTITRSTEVPPDYRFELTLTERSEQNVLRSQAGGLFLRG
jgi:hypothetical protein